MYIKKIVAGAALVFTLAIAFGINTQAGEPDLDTETRIAAEQGRNETIGYINATNVRLRSEGNLNSEILNTMNYGAKLTILSNGGEWCKVIHNDSMGYVFSEYVTPGEKEPNVVSGEVELVDWWKEGQSLMKKGAIATVTDVQTGVQFKVRILYGTNHSDVEPLTADDTAIMKQTRGGRWSWDQRAIWVTLENGRTIAASANGMPHGGSSIKDNNFPGHFCIHFLNSKVHGSNRINPRHQQQIKIAFEAASN